MKMTTKASTWALHGPRDASHAYIATAVRSADGAPNEGHVGLASKEEALSLAESILAGDESVAFVLVYAAGPDDVEIRDGAILRRDGAGPQPWGQDAAQAPEAPSL